ncbi:DUF4920 domain-containing protein [Fodinibius halophilus]|uniref:DUF4920 domain-containing protein n=1 Tax=Fodinibius halophilus TaxID=1736908 RepID=A0A6M1SUG7_9BACT|nr:DUF4920 domain-containing protein [Fodinibius halophilus]NGP87186.1 DUF4920 domain-containing protein [Fodinibius halophilus]
MKNIFLVILGFLFVANIGFAQEKVIRLSAPVEQGDNYEVFGDEFPQGMEVTGLERLIAKSADYKGQQVTTGGTIKKVCQKKGCFFMLGAQNGDVRIKFKDYSFFVPTNSTGKEAKLVGTFQVNELSEQKAKHYAKDAGEDTPKVEGPQKEYSVIATSVKIIDAER